MSSRLAILFMCIALFAVQMAYCEPGTPEECKEKCASECKEDFGQTGAPKCEIYGTSSIVCYCQRS